MTVDPSSHAHDRNWIESILGYIPGFHGYLEKEYRRESDALARKWIVDQLQEAKGAIDDLGRKMVEAGQIDDLPQCERFRTRIDGLINKLRGDVRGYSGLFDYVRIREDELEQVYALEVELMGEVKEFVAVMQELPTAEEPPADALTSRFKLLEEIEQKYKRRGELLEGLEETQS